MRAYQATCGLFVPIMAYSSLALANVSITAKGAKMALLTNGADSSDRCNYTFSEPTRCPFGPSNFDKDPKATRQNLDIRVSGDAAFFFEGLDAWAIDYICAHSERLFKKSLSLAQVKDMYHPCIRKAPGYEPLLRTKFNTAGTRGACRFWTPGGEEREAPVDWREADVTPHVHVSHLWMMGGSCGLVVNVCDLLVTEVSRSFPFPLME